MLQDGEGEQHVEHCAEGAADGVERHPDVLETQVVEGDHADEHEGQRKHLPGRLQVEAERREVDQARTQAGQQLHEPAQADRHQALEEGDEERRVQLAAVQQVVVEEHHGDGHEPVESHHGRDLPRADHERLRRTVLLRPARAAQSHLQYARPLQLGPVHHGKPTNTLGSEVLEEPRVEIRGYRPAAAGRELDLNITNQFRTRDSHSQ